MHVCCSALSLIPDAILIFPLLKVTLSLSSSVEDSGREVPATEILPTNAQHHLLLQHHFTLRCWCQVCRSACVNCQGRRWILMQGISWVLSGLIDHRCSLRFSTLGIVHRCTAVIMTTLSPSKFILDKFSDYSQQEAANVAGAIYISALVFTTVAGSLIVRIQTCLSLWIIRVEELTFELCHCACSRTLWVCGVSFCWPAPSSRCPCQPFWPSPTSLLSSPLYGWDWPTHLLLWVWIHLIVALN